VHVELQHHLNNKDTLNAVTAFEQEAADSGVTVAEYSTDNGSCFTSKTFAAHLLSSNQTVRYSGAGSHHQNGVAERAIKTIMAIARTMLLHSAIHWPDVADPTLWPMAVLHACYIWNRIPNEQSGLSPLDMWSRTRQPLTNLLKLHVWGSPVYVLDKKLADGKKIGRWVPRSHRCVYLGHSPRHSADVPLVLNLSTGSITPQWNVCHDDYFATVTSSLEELPDFNDAAWARMFGTSTYHLPAHERDELSSAEELRRPSQLQEETPNATADVVNVVPEPSAAPTPTPSTVPSAKPSPVPSTIHGAAPNSASSSSPKFVPNASPTPSNVPSTPTLRPDPVFRQVTAQAPRSPSPDRASSSGPSRDASASADSVVDAEPAEPAVELSGEAKKLADYLKPGASELVPLPAKRVRKQRQLYSNLCELTDPVLVEDESEMNQANIAATLAMWGALIAADNIGTPSTNYGCLGSINELPVHHYIYSFLSAKKKNPDIFSFDEVMSEPDPQRLAQWKASAVKEITELENKNVWEECLKSEANDKGVKIVPSTWVFRIKRTPDGEFSKCKARICLRGDLMDVNAEVFAPVVAWQTVRLFLVLSLNLGWPTVSVD
jgi:hypothetical protein